MSSDNGMREIGGYLRELEKVNRQLATENTQLRVSHSYRLGNAFVAFAKNRRIGGIPQLLRQIRQAMRPMQAHAPALPKRPDEFYDMLGASGSDLLRKRVEESPVGTRIIRQATLHGTSADLLRLVGVIGPDIATRWGAQSRMPASPMTGGMATGERWSRPTSSSTPTSWLASPVGTTSSRCAIQPLPSKRRPCCIRRGGRAW